MPQQTDWSGWVLPLVIFLAEASVVTIGTTRIILVARGARKLAPALGLAEISLWLFAIGQIMQNLGRLECYLGFAGGFVTGNYLGIVLEEKLAFGMSVVRIITRDQAEWLVEALRQAHFGVTCLDGRGATGHVNVIFTVVPRRSLETVVRLIEEHLPGAFYSVEDLRTTQAGVFPVSDLRNGNGFKRRLNLMRVGK
ncbi:MAG: hypothetical protein C4297_11560 [Gemmataceae bacterium]